MDQNDFLNDVDKFYFQWHITEKCNLRCSHCYQENYTDSLDLTLAESKEIADHIFETMSKWKKKADFSITGGEPFVKKDLFPLLEYLDTSEDVCNVDILSNGTMITENVTEKLRKFKKLHRIQISLDGGTQETHDRIRGSGAFKKAINGIRTLQQYGIDVKVMFTLHRGNRKDVPNLLDLAIKENISGLTIERLVPMGSSKDAQELLLSSDELKEVFQYVSDRADLEYNKGLPIRILKYRPLWININPDRAKSEVITIPHKELGAICSVGLDGLCIMPDATVLPCRRLPISIGNLKKDSIEKIWFQSDLLWQIRDKNNLKGKCHSCEYIPRCGGCRAMAYACTGDYLAEDPQCWK